MNVPVTPLLIAQGDTRDFADVREVVGRLVPTEPVYLFSQDSLGRRARCFQRGFSGTVSYAVKANPEPRIIRALAARGIRHFDVASPGEAALVAGLCPAATLHYNNPVKAEEAILTAYRDYGLRSFALDEMSELTKIRRATGGASDVMYSVRFRLEHRDASYDFGSKFGATPDRAAEMLRAIADAGARPALAFHPGSQCTDPQMYARYVKVAAEIAARAGVALVQLNVGGGFPEQYDATIPPLASFFAAIDVAMERAFCRPPPLMCEPGRAMVASSVSLLARVIHVREDQRTLFVNDGVYGGMQEQSLVDLPLPLKLWREGVQPRGRPHSYRIFGPTCDPVDRLSREMALPCRAKVGDYIEFGLLGAYGSATSTGFNGFRSTAYLNVGRGFLDKPSPVTAPGQDRSGFGAWVCASM